MSKRLEFDLTGMTCASCSARIESVLSAQPGVESATVNLALARGSVEASDDVVIAALEAAVADAGYGATLRTDASAPVDRSSPFRTRMLGALALAIPAAILGMGIDRRWAMIAAGVLVTPVVFWAAAPFYVQAVRLLRHRDASMDTLVAVGVSAAYAWSVFALIADREDVYFEVAGIVVAFILLGKHLEHLARTRAAAGIDALLRRAPKQASVIDPDGTERIIDAGAIEPGMRFRVRPGEQVPTDGRVAEGASALDESMVTGESVPVERAAGDDVIGGTINVDGTLIVEATRVGSETTLAQIAKLVEEAQTRKANVQRLADRVARIFVPIVLLIAAATAAGWLAWGDGGTGDAVRAAVAVLIVACPCAMGLATPAAIMAGTGAGASRGILIRGGEVLEACRTIDVVLLDKTGTLTEGRLEVAASIPLEGEDLRTVERNLVAVERGSEHPLARAIVERFATPPAPAGALLEIGRRPAPETAVTGFRAHRGRGAEAIVDGERVIAGSPELLFEERQMGCADLAMERERLERTGCTVISVAWGGRERGIVALRDRLRPTAPEAVRALHDLGLRTAILTGDNRAVAEQVAGSVGVTEVIADARPDDKIAAVDALRARGARVAVVGDGVNDAPALAAADLGIAIGTGSDVAIASADLTLVGDDPARIATAIELSRATYRVILQNLGWAFGYNIVLIPLAACGVVTPALAGLAMALSSVSVVTNALRLRRFAR
jgi:heavy metal translocating P-type ATPase